MKVSKNKIKALVMEAMSKTLNEKSELGNLTGEVTKNITNSKGGTVKIPNGYYKMPGTRLLTAEKGDPYEYTALINAKTEELAFMPVMDKNGGTSPKLNVGRVFDKGHKAHAKLLKRYNKNFPNEMGIKKKILDSKEGKELSSYLTKALQGANIDDVAVRKDIIFLATACRIFADPSSYSSEGGIFGSDDVNKNVEMLEALIEPHEKSIKEADPLYRLALYNTALKGLDEQEKRNVRDILSIINIKEPTESEIAKSTVYKNNKDIVAKSILFKDQDKPTISGEKEDANESKEINENRIRAIIRHELIQSMRK